MRLLFPLALVLVLPFAGTVEAVKTKYKVVHGVKQIKLEGEHAEHGRVIDLKVLKDGDDEGFEFHTPQKFVVHTKVVGKDGTIRRDSLTPHLAQSDPLDATGGREYDTGVFVESLMSEVLHVMPLGSIYEFDLEGDTYTLKMTQTEVEIREARKKRNAWPQTHHSDPQLDALSKMLHDDYAQQVAAGEHTSIGHEEL